MSTLSVRAETSPAGTQSACYLQGAELTFQCPECLAIETLFLENGMLTGMLHWRLYKGKVFHRDCVMPARLIDLSRRKIMIHSSTTVFLLGEIAKKKETVGQFAAHIGVSRITVKRWLLGKCYPNYTSRRRIARYTNTPMNVLFPKRKMNYEGCE